MQTLRVLTIMSKIWQRKTSSQSSTTLVKTPVQGSAVTETIAEGNSLFNKITNIAESYKYKAVGVTNTQLVNRTPGVYSIAGLDATKLIGRFGILEVKYKGFSEIVKLDFGGSQQYVDKVFTGYVAGSFGALALSSLLSKLAVGGQRNYYNGSTYSECAAKPGGIQRNPLCWGAAYDLSGVAVSYLWNGFWGGGAAITKRHYICSHHYVVQNKVGNTLRFVGSDGSIHTRTILAQTTGSDNSANTFANPYSDLCLFLLNSDLPTSVKVYPVAGDWIAPYSLTSVDGNQGKYTIDWSTPYITTNQGRDCLFTCASQLYQNYTVQHPLGTSGVGEAVYAVLPTSVALFNTTRYDAYPTYQARPIVGDSGSPVFYPLPNNGLALVTVMTTPSSGTRIYPAKANSMIKDVDARAGVSTGLTVTVAPDPTIS